MTTAIVAHRGECQDHFENTLESITAAINAGLKFIEIDIQLSKDGVAILYHDNNLKRLTGVDSPVAEVNAATLSKLTLQPTGKNTHKSASVHIATLAQVVALIAKHPEVTLFVEVKKGNFRYFSYQSVFHTVLKDLKAILNQVVIISFSYRFLRVCQKHSQLPLGYVLPNWQDFQPKLLALLKPKYIFCDIEIIPPTYQFNDQVYHWVLYETSGVEDVAHFHQRGVRYFETFFGEKLKQACQQIPALGQTI